MKKVICFSVVIFLVSIVLYSRHWEERSNAELSRSQQYSLGMGDFAQVRRNGVVSEGILFSGIKENIFVLICVERKRKYQVLIPFAQKEFCLLGRDFRVSDQPSHNYLHLEIKEVK